MKPNNLNLVLLTFLFLSFSIAGTSYVGILRISGIETSNVSEPNIDHVILIIIDGVRPSILLEANTPDLDDLVSEGSYTWKSWTTKPSNTISAVPSIVTGANPNIHRVATWDGQIHAETMIEVFEEAGLPCAIINQDPILGGYQANYSTGYDGSSGSDERSMTEAVDVFVDLRPYFMMIYNPIPDEMIHEHSHTSEEYFQSLGNASYHIGRLTDRLKDLGVFNRTLIVVTTDHGATGYSHSAQYETDMTTFSIWKGPGIKKNFEMKNHLYIYPTKTHDETIVAHRITDLAPTILKLVGLRDTKNNEGNAIDQIVESNKANFSTTTIFCTIPSPNIPLGLSTSISGIITPARSGVKVSIIYRRGGYWNLLSEVQSTSDGSFTYSWTPKDVGSIKIRASWEGDSMHVGAGSNTLNLLIETKTTPSNISCSVSKTEITQGDSITVSGTLDPELSNKTITLTFEKPDGSTQNRTVTTDSDGEYGDSFTPDTTGSWKISASWKGDNTYTGASSSTKSFTVKEQEQLSGCLIATATYGSELSPEVQFLRGFRDNTVLNTFAGTQFMNVFNQFYYSFSPTIASIIRENSIIKTVTKTALYPLIGILHLSSIVYSIFSFIPEIAIALSGFIASSLIGGIYLTPPIFILSRDERFKVNLKKIINSIFFISGISLVLLVMGEIMVSPEIMMISTGVFVLSNLSYIPLLFLTILKKKLDRN